MNKEASKNETKTITREAFLTAWFNGDVVQEEIFEKDGEGENASIVVDIDGRYYRAETYLSYGAHTLANHLVTTDPVQVFRKRKVVNYYE